MIPPQHNIFCCFSNKSVGSGVESLHLIKKRFNVDLKNKNKNDDEKQNKKKRIKNLLQESGCVFERGEVLIRGLSITNNFLNFLIDFFLDFWVL